MGHCWGTQGPQKPSTGMELALGLGSAGIFRGMGLEVTTPMKFRGKYSANPPGLCQWSSRRNSDFFQETFSPKCFLCLFAQVQIGILRGKWFSSQNPQRFHREGEGVGDSQVLGAFVKGQTSHGASLRVGHVPKSR